MVVENITTDGQLQSIIDMGLCIPVDIIYIKLPIESTNSQIPNQLGSGTYEENYKILTNDETAYVMVGRDLNGNRLSPMTNAEFDLWKQCFELTQFSLGLELQ